MESKTYIQLMVPIQNNEDWFRQLRKVLSGTDVKWQGKYYHITLAFIDDNPQHVNLVPIIAEQLDAMPPVEIKLDTLNVFTGGAGHVINLTASHLPVEFKCAVQSLRHALKAAGCRIDKNFLLHVTLGKVPLGYALLSELQSAVSTVTPPVINARLTDVQFRVYKGRTIRSFTLN
jgi:2'-5' RNA ligase